MCKRTSLFPVGMDGDGDFEVVGMVNVKDGGWIAILSEVFLGQLDANVVPVHVSHGPRNFSEYWISIITLFPGW